MIFAFLQVFSWYLVFTYCGAFSFIISEYHISSFILLYFQTIAFPSLPSSCQESGLWQLKLTAGFWNQWSELLWRQQVRHFPQPLLKPQCSFTYHRNFSQLGVSIVASSCSFSHYAKIKESKERWVQNFNNPNLSEGLIYVLKNTKYTIVQDFSVTPSLSLNSVHALH